MPRVTGTFQTTAGESLAVCAEVGRGAGSVGIFNMRLGSFSEALTQPPLVTRAFLRVATEQSEPETMPGAYCGLCTPSPGLAYLSKTYRIYKTHRTFFYLSPNNSNSQNPGGLGHKCALGLRGSRISAQVCKEPVPQDVPAAHWGLSLVAPWPKRNKSSRAQVALALPS